MSARMTVVLLLLSGIWGGSYALNEVGLRGFEPAALIEARFVFGAAVLLALVPFVRRARAGAAALRRLARPLALVALGNAVVPFWLIAWGQQHIDSGLTGILIASSPLFTALGALAYGRTQRVRGARLAGLVLGLAGVVLLLGQGGEGRSGTLGTLAILGAALLYAVTALYVGERLAGAPAYAIALGTTLWASVLMLPAALVQSPSELPGLGPLLAVAALGAGGTAIAYLLYFALIEGAGASRAILVNYLIPVLAVVYGVTLLDEPFTGRMAAGLVLVLAGVAFATGLARLRLRWLAP